MQGLGFRVGWYLLCRYPYMLCRLDIGFVETIPNNGESHGRETGKSKGNWCYMVVYTMPGLPKYVE